LKERWKNRGGREWRSEKKRGRDGRRKNSSVPLPVETRGSSMYRIDRWTRRKGVMWMQRQGMMERVMRGRHICRWRYKDIRVLSRVFVY